MVGSPLDNYLTHLTWRCLSPPRLAGFFNATQEGTYSQYVAVDEGQLAKLPGSITLDTAGGLPLVGLTAWQAIMEAKPIEGQRILVFAASGGVGHVAVQIAKSLGLYVVGVAGSSNRVSRDQATREGTARGHGHCWIQSSTVQNALQFTGFRQHCMVTQGMQ